MKGSETGGLLGRLKGAALVAALALLVPFVWLFVACNAKYRECVGLENGSYLGYEAVFDLRRQCFKPVAVPKFPDGVPLIRNETWAIHVTDTTIYDWAMGPTSESDYRFAWRRDIGLMTQQDEAATYDRLIPEAGHANWDLGIGSAGTGWLLNELIRRRQFAVQQSLSSLITS